MERLEFIASRDTLNRDHVVDCYTRLRKLADEQREEVVPLQRMQAQNDLIYRTIDLEARKAEDIIKTGGANREALIAEESNLQGQAEVALESSRQRTQEVANAYGIAPPDFSDRTRK